MCRRLKELGFSPLSLSDGNLYSSESSIKDYRPDNPDVVPLSYQSGYLTIQAYDGLRQRFTLVYPNDEVKYGFTESLVPEYLHDHLGKNGIDIFSIR